MASLSNTNILCVVVAITDQYHYKRRATQSNVRSDQRVDLSSEDQRPFGEHVGFVITPTYTCTCDTRYSFFFYVQPTFSFQFFTCVSFQISLAIERCPKFTFSTLTPDPDLHKLKFTQLRFTHTQIYTAQYWHTQIYTTQIYTKLNPNLHNPNLQNPNLHKTRIYRFINPWLGKG